MTRDDILNTVRDVLASEPAPVSAAWVFGSVGRDELRPDSDVDVGVLFAEAPKPVLDAPPARLEAALEAALARDVQVVDMHRAPCDLAHRVLRDGVLVADNDPSARIAFTVRSRNEYFDLLPILQRIRGTGGGQ